MKQRLEPYNGFKTYYTWWLWYKDFYDINNSYEMKELYEEYEEVYEDVDALAEALYDRYEECDHPEFERDGIDWYELAESVSELIKEYVDELRGAEEAKKIEEEELSRKIRERINKVGVYNVGNMRQEEFDEAFGDIFSHT